MSSTRRFECNVYIAFQSIVLYYTVFRENCVVWHSKALQPLLEFSNGSTGTMI